MSSWLTSPRLRMGTNSSPTSSSTANSDWGMKTVDSTGKHKPVTFRPSAPPLKPPCAHENRPWPEPRACTSFSVAVWWGRGTERAGSGPGNSEPRRRAQRRSRLRKGALLEERVLPTHGLDSRLGALGTKRHLTAELSRARGGRGLRSPCPTSSFTEEEPRTHRGVCARPGLLPAGGGEPSAPRHVYMLFFCPKCAPLP